MTLKERISEALKDKMQLFGFDVPDAMAGELAAAAIEQFKRFVADA